MHDDLDQRTQSASGLLRRLPDELQPPFDWQEFKERAQLQHRRSLSSQRAWKLAAAAIVVAAIATAAFLDRIVGLAPGGQHPAIARESEHASVPMHVPRPARATVPERVPAPADEQPSPDGVSNVAADHSQAIETWLASLPHEPIVVRVGTRAAVAGLEDRIAQVDDLLTAARLDGGEPNGLARLQQERTRLVGSLAQVRYAEVVAAQSP